VASADAGELPGRRLRCTLGLSAALGREALSGLTSYLSAPKEPAQPSELRREPPQPSKL